MKITICLIAAMLVFGAIYMMFTCVNCEPFLSFENSLNHRQKMIYKFIVQERMSLYIRGLIWGTILAFGYLYFFKGTINIMSDCCVFSVILLLTLNFCYLLSPKTTYMLQHLNSKEQVDAWLNVYKFMMYRYHFGMLLGAAGYFLFAFGILSK